MVKIIFLFFKFSFETKIIKTTVLLVGHLTWNLLFFEYYVKRSKKRNFSTKGEKVNKTSKKLSLFDGFDAIFNRIYYNLI